MAVRESPVPSPHDLDLARRIWDFHRIEHPLRHCDAILNLCSHDIRVAAYAARLHTQGWAPLLIFSGGGSPFTSTIYTEAEARAFAAVAIAHGVPDDQIVIEDRSTNTGENIRFTQALLTDRGIAVKSCVLVQKPNMLRRAFASLQKIWPEIDACVSGPPEIAFETACHRHFTPAMLIDELVGDLQRLIVYPARGFLVPQPIPADVLAAYETLVARGYVGYCVAGSPTQPPAGT